MSRGCDTECAGRTGRTRQPAKTGAIHGILSGALLALAPAVIWFLEKQDDLLVCEIRRAGDNESVYEFEIVDAAGPKTLRFESPKELISTYLAEHSRLAAEGWRPRAGNVAALE